MDCWPDENLNYVRLKIKTKKKPTCGYALQNYYRCIHNIGDWSPSKDPRRKLKLNPSARVKNTNCPFQMVMKIQQESCWTFDIEWEHNQSVQSLSGCSPWLCRACLPVVWKWPHSINTYRTFEYPAKTGWTSTRRKLIHEWCHEEEILITCTQVHNFAKRHWGIGGGRGDLMFSKLVENLPAVWEREPSSNHKSPDIWRW